MISDILRKSLEEIGFYQADYPTIYDGLTTDIEAVKKSMRALLEKLHAAETGQTINKEASEEKQ
ncbi:MAG TPA: hypothetical protein VF735_15140 [Pyrinomonadaceae bacterium]|jgi:hypothetical protein